MLFPVFADFVLAGDSRVVTHFATTPEPEVGANRMAQNQASAAAATQPLAEMISPLVQYDDRDAYVGAINNGSYWSDASGTSLNGGDAYMTKSGIHGRINIRTNSDENVDGDTVILGFYKLDGDTEILESDYVWSADNQCWQFQNNGSTVCFPLNYIGKSLFPGGVAGWRFELKVNNVLIYSENFNVVPPAFSIIGQSSFNGEAGDSVSSPLTVQLLHYEGGSPVPNFEIAYRLSVVGTNGYYLYSTPDMTLGGTKTLTVNTDENGIAKA